MNVLFTFSNSSDGNNLSVKDINKISKLKKRVLFLAFLALSLNLRSPITSLPPVIGFVRDHFGISAGAAGTLTSIPVLCFGVLTVPIGYLMKKMTVESAVFVTLIGIVIGGAVRSFGSITAMVAGTVILGVSLTVGNIAGLMVIGRDYRSHIGTMTGVYVSGMSIGAMMTTALTAPFVGWVGWQMSLAFCAETALAAAVVWGYAASLTRMETKYIEKMKPGAAPDRRGKPSASSSASSGKSVYKKPIVWLLAAAFAAHTFIFYGMTAWLPDYLITALKMSDKTAGYAASLFQILGLLGCFGISFLGSTKKFSNNALFAVVTVSWILMPSGMLLFPRLWLLWIVFGAIGSGGGFTVIFGMVMKHAADLDENRMMSSFVQSVGYIFASVSPAVIGVIYHMTSRWSYCFIMMTAAAFFMALCGVFASREAKE